MNAKGAMVEGTLPATAISHPVSLGFTVHFDEAKQIFPTNQMKVPLNRYLGTGTHMFVTGVTLAQLKELCGEGEEEEISGDGRSTDDEGTDLNSSGDEEDDD